MRQSIKTGFSFGLTSGIITTLGLMVGLSSGNASISIIIGGIITIAIADAMSDALGIHMSEESKVDQNPIEVWESTFSTFLFKFIFALTFVIPLLLFSLKVAVIISIIWGVSLLSIFSFFIAKQKNANSKEVIFEHLFIAILVIVITHYIGIFVNSFFK